MWYIEKIIISNNNNNNNILLKIPFYEKVFLTKGL
jgi:hypothetical protein